MSKPAPQSNTDRRRGLKLLASNADGCTEAIMLAHGFTVEFLVDMVRAGLATAQPERMRAGGHPIEVTRWRIAASELCGLRRLQKKAMSAMWPAIVKISSGQAPIGPGGLRAPQ